jgi:hypothetical protein
MARTDGDPRHAEEWHTSNSGWRECPKCKMTFEDYGDPECPYCLSPVSHPYRPAPAQEEVIVSSDDWSRAWHSRDAEVKGYVTVLRQAREALTRKGGVCQIPYNENHYLCKKCEVRLDCAALSEIDKVLGGEQ